MRKLRIADNLVQITSSPTKLDAFKKAYMLQLGSLMKNKHEFVNLFSGMGIVMLEEVVHMSSGRKDPEAERMKRKKAKFM